MTNNPTTGQATKTTGSESAAESCCDVQPIDDLMNYCREYAREKPEMAALWCFGIGFVLGWKLKPW